MPQILKIAHRGYSERYPENTVPAFEKAIEAGADMIELDVHLTADGHLVVIHDDDIDRTSNGTGRVKHMTLKELKKYDYCNRRPGFNNINIPLLEDVIEVCRKKILLNIEIKNLPSRYEGIENRLIDVLKKTGFIGDAVVSSFDHYSLSRVKEIEPAVKTGMLFDSLWLSFQEEAGLLKVSSVHPSIDAFDEAQMAWARGKGLHVYPWVAKKKETMDYLRGTGLVDGIMVNELELFD